MQHIHTYSCDVSYMLVVWFSFLTFPRKYILNTLIFVTIISIFPQLIMSNKWTIIVHLTEKQYLDIFSSFKLEKGKFQPNLAINNAFEYSILDYFKNSFHGGKGEANNPFFI